MSPTYISYLLSCFLTTSSRFVISTECAVNSTTVTRHIAVTFLDTAEISTGSDVTFNPLTCPLASTETLSLSEEYHSTSLSDSGSSVGSTVTDKSADSSTKS